MAYSHRRLDDEVPAHLVNVEHRLQLSPENRWDRAKPTIFHGQQDGQYIVNPYGMDRAPELPPLEYPRTRLDYRLGPHDPLLYPQMWNHSAPHLGWIEYRPLHRDLYKDHIVSYVFQETDWSPLYPGAAYGMISREVVTRLRDKFYDIHKYVIPLFAQARTKWLLPKATISHCMKLLSEFQTMAATFVESALNVTRVQRGIAELLAFYRFRMDVKYHVQGRHYVSEICYLYVGVFTTDRHISSLLHRLGIPVWLVVQGLPQQFKAEDVLDTTAWTTAVESAMLEAVPVDEMDLDLPSQSGAASSSRTRSRSRSPVPRLPRERRRSRSPSSSRAQSSLSGVFRGPPMYMQNEQPRLRAGGVFMLISSETSRLTCIRSAP